MVSTWSTGTIPRCGFRGPKLISPAEFIRGVPSSLKAVRRIYAHWQLSWSSKLRSFTIDTYGFLAISLKYLDVFPLTNLGRTWRCLSSTAGYPASTVAFASSPGEEKTSPYMSEQLFSHLEVMCSTSQTGGKQVKIAEIKGDNSTKIGEIWRKEAPAEFPCYQTQSQWPFSRSVTGGCHCLKRLALATRAGAHQWAYNIYNVGDLRWLENLG